MKKTFLLLYMSAAMAYPEVVKLSETPLSIPSPSGLVAANLQRYQLKPEMIEVDVVHVPSASEWWIGENFQHFFLSDGRLYGLQTTRGELLVIRPSVQPPPLSPELNDESALVYLQGRDSGPAGKEGRVFDLQRILGPEPFGGGGDRAISTPNQKRGIEGRFPSFGIGRAKWVLGQSSG